MEPLAPPDPLDPITQADEVIRAASPGLWAALSPLGRRVRQPESFLPLQTLEARGKTFNATIGQITDGHGRAVPLPSMAAAVAGLGEAEASQAFLYSPVDGLPELRRLWRERQRRGVPPELPSSLPIVTLGTAHARALAADLFAAEGREVILPEPFRLSDHELFARRYGARVLCSLNEVSGEEPVLALLDSPLPESRRLLLDSLAAVAARRPLVVVVDDTWSDQAPARSLFWDLVQLREGLIPLKVDGADGALGFAGGRVGFLTLPWEPDSALTRAVESKLKMLLRAEVGSPSAATQTFLARALRDERPGR